MNFKTYLVCLVVLLASVAVGVNSASAVGDAYFPQDTTLVINSNNYTITGGSDADSVVTSATNTVITTSAGRSLTITSANRYRLSNDGGFETGCSDTLSTLVISVASGGASKVVTVTPADTNPNFCVSSGSSGSGGRGSRTIPFSPTPTTSVTPTVSPIPIPVQTNKPTPVSNGFVSLVALNLKEGDTISATGSSDPDIYIANVHGYKRLFLNPVIFNFYGHLGGFTKVKQIVSKTRDTLVTSGLYRNCETNDPKVYGVETTGEDTGRLHWVNTTGVQAIADDPNFFKKVFCINNKELNWYSKGADYTSVNQVPDYSR